MKQVEKYAYMIQREKDGLFSTGGTSPKFTKNGKTWSNLGHLKNHLHLFHDYRGRSFGFPYEGCKIVVLKSVLVLESLQKDEADVEKLFRTMTREAEREYNERNQPRSNQVC